MVKRFFDVVASATLFLLMSPLMLVIALFVKMTSKGSVIFRQERVGFHNTPFIILKFRTMEEGDGRKITKVGQFLRPMHFDELPQLINVLKGEMSLVGPRPWKACVLIFGREKVADIDRRHRVRPGITGPAQIFGHAGIEREIAAAVLLDLAYVEEHSLLGDIRIIIQTIPTILKRKGI